MMIGERLSDLRKDRNLTQKELAEELCINFRTYSGYEREESEASDDIKLRIARYFNVSIDYLLGLIDKPHPIDLGTEYVRLPFRFSQEAQRDLSMFMDFLVSREKNDRFKK